MAKEAPFDPYEFGARNADPETGGLEPLLPLPTRFRPRQLALAFLAVFVIGALLRGGGTRLSPLPASCTTPTYSVSTISIKRYGVVRWTAVGPRDSRVVLAVDSPKLPTASALPTGAGRVFGPTLLTACSASGQFGVTAPAGRHTVTAFAVAPDGGVTPLGSRPLEVRAP